MLEKDFEGCWSCLFFHYPRLSNGGSIFLDTQGGICTKDPEKPLVVRNFMTPRQALDFNNLNPISRREMLRKQKTCYRFGEEDYILEQQFMSLAVAIANIENQIDFSTLGH